MRSPSAHAADRTGVRTVRVKLIWLAMFRTVAAALLLATVAIRLLSRDPVQPLGPEDSVTFAVIGLVFFLNIVYGVWLRRSEVGTRSAYVQVLGDVVLATGLIYLTGGADSPFTFAYSLAVIAGATILYQRGAVVAAVFSAFAFATLLVLVEEGVLRPPLGSGAGLGATRLMLVVATNALAQMLVGILAAFLTRELRLTGSELFAREAEVRSLQRLQSQIMASMPSGLITCSQDGRITFVNRAGAAILDAGNDALGRQIDDVMPGVLSADHARRTELQLTRKGENLTLGITAVPLDSEQMGLLVVFQDLTELRRTEEMLHRTDRLAELGTMAAQLAHEIGNPLAAMRGAAQILDKEPDASPSHKTLTTILVRETERLGALVRDFLKFARPSAPQTATMDLAQIVKETVEMVRADPSAGRIRIELDGAPVQAWVDADQMRQVLLNLIRNAVAVVGPGGSVRLTTGIQRGYALLRVWDSAGAIPPENLKRVFDPFFTTREGGTGLGLSTAHSIINAHGGSIQVTSSPATGTEFLITLPLRREEAHADSGR